MEAYGVEALISDRGNFKLKVEGELKVDVTCSEITMDTKAEEK